MNDTDDGGGRADKHQILTLPDILLLDSTNLFKNWWFGWVFGFFLR